MDTSTGRKIEIFAPFEAAYHLMKLILFQPFDLAKWCVIAFAAFLSHLAGGGGRVSYNPRLGNGNWHYRATTHDAMQSFDGMPGWVIPLVVLGLLLLLVIVIVLLWVGSRGKFIFTDCIVRNRGRIVEPWHEYRKEGDSYFCFRLLIGLGVLVILGLASFPLWLPLALHHGMPEGLSLILGLTSFGLVAIFLMVVIGVISSFMIPIMYGRRCGASEAFGAALGIISAEPGPVILYLLFIVVLWIAFAMGACLLTCVTCCIAAIPYVGTVILLPAYVFFMSYLLLFVRQFGPEYDAWANIAPSQLVEPLVEAPAIPPAETLSTPPSLPPDPPIQT